MDLSYLERLVSTVVREDIYLPKKIRRDIQMYNYLFKKGSDFEFSSFAYFIFAVGIYIKILLIKKYLTKYQAQLSCFCCIGCSKLNFMIIPILPLHNSYISDIKNHC